MERAEKAQKGAAEERSGANAPSEEARPSFRFAPPGSAARRSASGGGSAALVEDGARTSTGQCCRSEFIRRARDAVFAAADEELQSAGLSAEHCPFLEAWVERVAARPNESIERFITLYARPRPGASADRLRDALASRVRNSVRRWREQGIIESPEPGAIPSAIDHDPKLKAAMEAQRRLGAGRPMEASVRRRMESAFGRDLGHVRIHDDAAAAAIAQEHGARAFTVGRDVGFANGSYAPGTTRGDAILAHELAHVLQVARVPGAGREREADAERGADIAALAVAQRLRGDAVQAPAIEGRSGPLVLRRCGEDWAPTPREHDDAVPADDAGVEEDAAASAPPDGAEPPPIPDSEAAVTVPDSWISDYADDDLLVIRANGRAIAIPAAGNAVRITPPAGQEVQPGTFLGVPTAGKEGVRLVRAGGQVGFLVDAGGVPTALMPAAVGGIQQALGVTTIQSLVILHIHSDHIRNIEQYIETHGIRAENFRFPSSFATAGGMFGRILQRLRSTTEPRLTALGYGQGQATAFGVIPVPTAGAFFTHAWTEGNVRVEVFGLNAPFQQVANRTARGATADRASLLMRLTEAEFGVRALVLGDLRGRDISELHTQMGSTAFGAIFDGVRVLVGFQHHLGSMSDPADRAGNELLLRELASRTGQITVISQSQTTSYGRSTHSFLNRSLIEALRQFGVDVAVARRAADGNLGNVTVDQAGNPQVSGANVMLGRGDAQVQARHQRYQALNRSVEVLEANRTILRTASGAPPDAALESLRAARNQLGEALGLRARAGQSAPDGLLQLLLAGVGTGSAQARAQLTNQAQVDALRPSVLRAHPAETMLEQRGFSEMVQMLATHGETIRQFNREIQTMRRTGRVSEDLLWSLGRLHPEAAERLLRGAELPESRRRALQEQIRQARGGAAIGRGMVAGFLIFVEVVNQIGPAVAQYRSNANADNVLDHYNLIQWWQGKNVVPTMRAVYNPLTGTTIDSRDPHAISQMLSSNHIDYLALEDIPDEEAWDRFNLWVMTHVINVHDFNVLIWEKPSRLNNAVDLVDGQWKYRTGTISDATIGYDLDETWRTHPRFTTIMSAMFSQVFSETQQQLDSAWANRASALPDGPAVSSMDYHTRPMLEGTPPIRRVRFRENGDRDAYAVSNRGIGMRKVLDGDDWWEADPELFVLDSMHEGSVESGYLLVVGAKARTFLQLTRVRSWFWNGEREVYSQRNPTGRVLVEASEVVDVGGSP